MTLFQYAMILIHMKETNHRKRSEKNKYKKEEYREQFTWSWTL